MIFNIFLFNKLYLLKHNYSFQVEILCGRDKGKQGIVGTVIQERNWVLVDGLNKEIQVKEKETDVPAVVISEEKPLRVTDQVSLVDPSDL